MSFLLAWLANPLRVGAISPSGRALANVVTVEITSACAPIIELGPGTGTDVFTRSLISRGIPEDRAALTGHDADLREHSSGCLPGPMCSRWMRRALRISTCSTASAPARS